MRRYCSTCEFPLSTCVCSAIENLSSPVKLTILQHHKEAGHAKNTARLVPLAIQNAQIVAGSRPEDFHPAQQLCNQYRSAVIYPCSGSQPIESTAFSQHLPEQLIFLDGSWRQAYALYQQLTWLHPLPCWHFQQAPASGYHIRHTNKSDSLSTLEAVAYCLSQGYQCNSASLLTLQQRMQQFWQGPAKHQRISD